MKLPLKTRILEYAIEENKPLSAEEITEALKKEYEGERFCNYKNIDTLLDAYCGVGVMKATDMYFDDKGKLVVKYQVTKFGKDYERLIPGHES
ncbi:MAG TPA: hypothetical protein IAC50_07020 [Candidatus Copromorpha excrementigallinarum]|uniref:Uncharacterized protein n=1 Tax=Candidatus Allocopromorpha excrementigallinarum TaxID=2840742 RepID=A0A9D1L6Q4_9FIRM|nr:hypothetical protein [Candidatus Copromorpha excrementigallinarum]